MTLENPPHYRRGVLCGAERSQEWLLPWWWSRYKEHNAYPVTFCDFGMTDKMRAWCKERGTLIQVELDPHLIASRSAISDVLVKRWEKIYGQGVWHARHTWFKKPFALLQSPYEQGIWIDSDCEILAPIEPLFAQFDPAAQLALVREYDTDHLPRLHPDIRYNSGVVAFQRGAPILELWAKEATLQNHLFWGDDPLLSHLICQYQLMVQELPDIYNWRIGCGLNINAAIVHWAGTGGKAYIRKYGGLKPGLDAFHMRE